MELASLDRLLFLLSLIPSGQVQKIYAIPFVPWLVAFSIPFLMIWSQPRPQRAIYAIPLLFFLNSNIAVQILYNCEPDERNGGVSGVLEEKMYEQ
ncbi:hypothetical protein NA56DRAFT_640149 [Hyaloscypha hepaticicola]|uniref:Uncharacterized protein n=1 Tax=Hyaloscypha hepaticicola TaxID=2082293 RepID=A0A2J6QQI2_9HELO|nr:hypothetical protein NA56DRAFT_640149 [Hyaloscypha hepaticicola]